MNRILYIIIPIMLLAACSVSNEKGLDVMILERDSLNIAHERISKRLSELEAEIAAKDTSRRITSVTAVRLNSTNFKHYFTAQANLEAEFNAQVYPEISGVIKQIYVSEGQTVAKGQKLIHIDTELIRRNLQEVETNYNLALDIFNRQQNLWDQKIGSEVQYLEAKNRKESLGNTMATIRQQISMGTITAPFAGVVDEIIPKVGEMANPMAPVIRVINLDELYLKADISENYTTVVKEKMKAEVIFPGIDTLSAEVDRVGKFINPENRTFKIRVNLKESNELLKPNLYATMRLLDFSADSTISIPTGMILEDFEGENYVFVLNKNGSDYKVEKRNVQSGLTYEGMTHIKKGLEIGERIIDKGARKVVDGEIVTIIGETESSNVALN